MLFEPKLDFQIFLLYIMFDRSTSQLLNILFYFSGRCCKKHPIKKVFDAYVLTLCHIQHIYIDTNKCNVLMSRYDAGRL